MPTRVLEVKLGRIFSMLWAVTLLTVLLCRNSLIPLAACVDAGVGSLLLLFYVEGSCRPQYLIGNPLFAWETFSALGFKIRSLIHFWTEFSAR